MAKRKRLDPARIETAASEGSAAVSRSMFPEYPATGLQPPRRAPIADVAGDAASVAAFEELAQTLSDAKREGRMIQRLPLEAIEANYLVRDRMVVDDEEMQALRDSLRTRGQQTAIEVADTGDGRWGLISGWRRLTALRHLNSENPAEFDTVLAVVRKPDEAAEAYVAMVEENEIRVGLSYYERAHVVVRAVDKGVFRSDRAALTRLFSAASRSKRSKIGSFVRIVRSLDDVLKFPTALTERTGLAVAAALEAEPSLQERLRHALVETPPSSAEQEAKVLTRILARQKGPERPDRSVPMKLRNSPLDPPRTIDAGTEDSGSDPIEELCDGLAAQYHDDGRITLSGRLLHSKAFRRDLLGWLGKKSQTSSL